MSGKQFATIVTITFIVGMIWLISDIIFNTKPSISVSTQLESLLKPINPNFDSRVLNVIDKEVVDSGLAQSSSRNSPSSVSTNPSATESATPSGQTR